MATPSQSCPLPYFLRRQFDERINIKGRLLKERLSKATNLYSKDLLAHFGCVNAIEFSNSGRFLVSGGDDRRVLIWNVDQAVHSFGTPSVMRANHISNIFCLAFDSTNSRVFSAGNDDQVIVHDAATGDPLDFFLHEQPVYGLSIDPVNDYVFASACDDGRVLIYDIREAPSSEPFCLARYNAAFHAVMFNPVESRLLTTANSKEGVGLWDVRKPCQVLMRFGGNQQSQSCMSVRFNQAGTQILALRRRQPPVLYSVHSSLHICQFDHPGYYNSCTMKSCSFAGDNDEYVLSGSDDFNLYMWKTPKTNDEDQWVDRAHMVLRGHRSIVNQVRFHPTNCLIASSGVEKLIKFWSPYPLPNSVGSLVEGQKCGTKQRKVFTHEEYIRLVLRTGQFMTHDYSHQSTKEDPRMMAFFDSLVQREIEGWITEEVVSSDIDTNGYTAVASSQSDSEPAFGASNGEIVDPSESEPEGSQNRITQLIARKRAQTMRHAKSQNVENSVELKKSNRRSRKYMNSASFVSDSSDSEPDVSSKRLRAKNPDGTFRKIFLRNRSPKRNGKLVSKEKCKMPVSNLRNKKELKQNCDIRKHRLKYMIAYSDSSDENNENNNEKKDHASDSSVVTSTDEYAIAGWDERGMVWERGRGDESDRGEGEEKNKKKESRQKVGKKTVKCSKKSHTLGTQSFESTSMKTDNVTIIEASTSSMHNSEAGSNQARRFCRKRRKMNTEKRRKINLNILETSSSDDAEANKLGMVVRTYECKSKTSKYKNAEQDCKGNLIEHNNNNNDNFDSITDGKLKEEFSSSVSETVHNPMNKVPTASNGSLNTVTDALPENLDSNCSKSDVLNGNNSVIGATNSDTPVRAIPTSVITSVYSTPNGKESNSSLEDYKTPDSGIVLKECTSTGSTNSVVGVPCQPSCSSNFNFPTQDSSPNGGNGNDNWTVFKKFRIKNRERIRRNFRSHHDDSDSP